MSRRRSTDRAVAPARGAAAARGGQPAGRRAAARATPAREPGRGSTLAILGLILGAAVVLQREALRATFFADDYLFLDQVRYRSLIGALASADPIGNFVRPVGRQLHFWWLSHLTHESPMAFHLANLAVFLGVIAMLFGLVRTLAGTRAAAVAAAILALHEAADVPLRWAAGSQDLLALAGALGAMWLAVRGRAWWGAAALLAGLLAKETVAATPLIAVLLLEGSWRARLRRAAPLALAWVGWGLVWWIAHRPGGSAGLQAPGFSDLMAVLVHLAQTVFGLEWRHDQPLHGLMAAPPVLALAAAAGAVWLAARGARPARSLVTAGLAWALLAALPVAPVVQGWSAYYFLFAVCGGAVAIGTWLAQRSRATMVACVVVLGLASHATRHVDEFANQRGSWTGQSHVNRYYLVRGMALVQRYLGMVRRARPVMPHHATVYYAGLPDFSGLQSGDGPVLRWAYRDSSLRSYYLSAFSRTARRPGQKLLFEGGGDTLIERRLDTDMLASIAVSTLLADDSASARIAAEEIIRRSPGYAGPHLLHAWLSIAAGDQAGAIADLRAAGATPDPGPSPEIATAMRQLAHGDTAAALTTARAAATAHAFDPGAHALLADIRANNISTGFGEAVTEAYAALVLQPTFSRHWWRWGYLQASTRHPEQAAVSLRRFLAMGGDPDDEAAARLVLADVERRLPGGDLARSALRTLPRR